MHDALVEFAEEHQISIFFAEESVAGMTVPPISGQFSLTEALTRILHGHCLRHEFVRDTFVAIQIVALALLALWPELATWLPEVVYGR